MGNPNCYRALELDSHSATRPAKRAQVNFLANLAVGRISDKKFRVESSDLKSISELYKGEDSFGGTRIAITLKAGASKKCPDVKLNIDSYFPGEPGYARLVKRTECWLVSQNFLWRGNYGLLYLRDKYFQCKGIDVSPVFEDTAALPNFDVIDTNHFDCHDRERQVKELTGMWHGESPLTRSRCSELTRQVAMFDPERAVAIEINERS